MLEDKLPIAETFVSIQGEGAWVGTRMLFIRLAGCNVGRYEGYEKVKPQGVLPVLPTKPYAICHTVDGQPFLCDTDYHRTSVMTFQELEKRLLDSGCQHVCLTGGEPLLHQETLTRLLGVEAFDNVRIHVETSGTVAIGDLWDGNRCGHAWIACSPKRGLLESNRRFVSEWKFLVGPDTDLGVLISYLSACFSPGSNVPAYIQPVNNVGTLDLEMLEKCLALQKLFPEARLSVQLHKLIGVR